MKFTWSQSTWITNKAVLWFVKCRVNQHTIHSSSNTQVTSVQTASLAWSLSNVYVHELCILLIENKNISLNMQYYICTCTVSHWLYCLSFALKRCYLFFSLWRTSEFTNNTYLQLASPGKNTRACSQAKLLYPVQFCGTWWSYVTTCQKKHFQMCVMTSQLLLLKLRLVSFSSTLQQFLPDMALPSNMKAILLYCQKGNQCHLFYLGKLSFHRQPEEVKKFGSSTPTCF